MRNHFLTDWNCNLLPGLSDCPDSVLRSRDTLELLHERSGFNRFYFLPEFDPDAESVAGFRLRMDRSLSVLRGVLCPSLLLAATAAVRLVPRLSEYQNIHRFRIPKTDFLPICLPPIPQDTTEVDLAHLVRHGNHRVLITNAHVLLILYPEDVRNRIFRLPHLAFLFSYGVLENPSNDGYLRRLVANRSPVLFGSFVRNFAMAGQFDREWLASLAQQRFAAEEFRTLFDDHRAIFRKPSR